MADHKLNSKVSNEDNRNNKEKKQLMSNNKIKWSSIINPNHTPAITMVDECSKAEIGVGADIAFNNQLVKGNWADLEKIIIKIGIEKRLP
jgi:hypothetical protein